MRNSYHLLWLLLALGLTACKEDLPAEKYTAQKILLIGNGNEPAGLDPQIVTGVIESNIISSLFEGLCVQHPSKEGVHLPGAAKSWKANDDFTEWTFHLQPDGRWSDGKPLTSADFLFSYERILNPDFAAKYSSMLYYIKGAEQYNKGEISDFSEVGVKAIDPHTLKIILRASIPFLPDLTKHYTWFPVPKHTVLKFGGAHERFTQWTDVDNMVSNGPFVMSVWRFNDKIEVTKNPHYWDKKTVQLNAIRFLPISNKYTEARMFFNHQMHATERLAPEMIEYSRKNYPKQLRQETYLGTNFMRFNMTRAKLQDLRVRKAFSMATDRQLIIDKVIKGGEIPARGMVPPMGMYQSIDMISYDPEAARKLMNDAGFSESNKLKVTLLTTDKDGAKTQAEAYQDMWQKALPVEVSIQQREWKTYLNLMSELDYDIATGGWIGDYPDPTTFLDIWKKGDGNNRTGWSSEAYEAILSKAEKTQDPTRRVAILREAEKVFIGDMPIIPLYWYTSVYLLHDSVKNWHPLLLKNQPYKFLYLQN